MSADSEYAGDYGYDMVQEVKAALQVPAARRRLRPAGRGPGREIDLDGDFGYDQAHDL